MDERPQREALEYPRAHPCGVKAAQIADRLWLDSYMHKKTSTQGHGTCKGKAAWLCGGAYLSKLAKRGWVTWYSGLIETWAYYLTPAGLELLNAASESEG